MSISSLCLEIREEESCEHERYYVDVTKDCLHFSPLCLPLCLPLSQLMINIL